jgi:hypothetical protein
MTEAREIHGKQEAFFLHEHQKTAVAIIYEK